MLTNENGRDGKEEIVEEVIEGELDANLVKIAFDKADIIRMLESLQLRAGTLQEKLIKMDRPESIEESDILLGRLAYLHWRLGDALRIFEVKKIEPEVTKIGEYIEIGGIERFYHYKSLGKKAVKDLDYDDLKTKKDKNGRQVLYGYKYHKDAYKFDSFLKPNKATENTESSKKLIKHDNNGDARCEFVDANTRKAAREAGSGKAFL